MKIARAWFRKEAASFRPNWSFQCNLCWHVWGLGASVHLGRRGMVYLILGPAEASLWWGS